GILHHLREAVSGSLHYSIVRFRRIPPPLGRLGNVYEVGAKDHAHVVELKSLCGVYTTDLFGTTDVIGPKTLFRNSWCEAACIRPCIPGTSVVADNNVIY